MATYKTFLILREQLLSSSPSPPRTTDNLAYTRIFINLYTFSLSHEIFFKPKEQQKTTRTKPHARCKQKDAKCAILSPNLFCLQIQLIHWKAWILKHPIGSCTLNQRGVDAAMRFDRQVEYDFSWRHNIGQRVYLCNAKSSINNKKEAKMRYHILPGHPKTKSKWLVSPCNFHLVFQTIPLGIFAWKIATESDFPL